MKEIFQKIWKMALPYQDKRNDKGHTKTVLEYVLKLSNTEKVDDDIIIPAAILHDVGWSQVKERMKFFEIKDGKTKETIAKKHEELGIGIAKQILEKVNYDKDKINEILEIISKHDIREGFISKNEGIVRDADKLWRYSKKGFWLDVKRTNSTKEERFKKIEKRINAPEFFYSKNAKKIAKEELEKRKEEFDVPVKVTTFLLFCSHL